MRFGHDLRQCRGRASRARIKDAMDRIDVYPTHEFDGFKLRPGRPYPFGATLVPGGVNFSDLLAACELLRARALREGRSRTVRRDPLPRLVREARHAGAVWGDFRVGNVFCDGRLRPRLREHRVRLPHGRARSARERGRPAFHRSTREDPARPLRQGHRRPRRLGRSSRTGTMPTRTAAGSSTTTSTGSDDRPLEIPIEDLVIYEMHVRGFTRHPSSGVKHPGHLRRRSARRSPI